ncbi:hypothetical protein D9615_009018 [Tricholomella constricta]|uniref:Uncharacterized protein n=1 Tax=Tricholomella constricta TaxID=117010 RepID=A0A8H5H1J0_9AGAR|nr:hypothetical protein D9615_009018 [Tricholomella constricta]
MSLAGPDPLFMCVAVAHESPGKSFEELRIDDYIRFYSTTGRPPPPCPQEPTDEALRARSGLPPLFKPFAERSLASSTSRPTDLPNAQTFSAPKYEGEFLHSISAMAPYEAFSHEELRYYAYLKGNKTAPAHITMTPFVPSPPPTDASATIRILDLPGQGEQMMTISTQPAYAGHSLEVSPSQFYCPRTCRSPTFPLSVPVFSPPGTTQPNPIASQELRLAYIQAGLQLTSAEILARTPRPPSLFGSGASTSTGASTGGGLFSRPAGVRLF